MIEAAAAVMVFARAVQVAAVGAVGMRLLVGLPVTVKVTQDLHVGKK